MKCLYPYNLLHAQLLSRVRLCTTAHTIAHQAPLSMGFSRQESWSGLPFPPPGDLPNQELNPSLLGLLRCMQILALCQLESPRSQIC